ncbi:hypothetical protein [Xenophilus azovorans]|uniref:hypothetical protein n=1 Tax=Xenophilus azovorans TaxID=151755 RepID=UPI0005705751|nr:hypothetical protein [Xenophilus azovorans]
MTTKPPHLNPSAMTDEQLREEIGRLMAETIKLAEGDRGYSWLPYVAILAAMAAGTALAFIAR